ncbi:MAG: PAS domain-containing protein [Phycisphaerae bacterium]
MIGDAQSAVLDAVLRHRRAGVILRDAETGDILSIDETACAIAGVLEEDVVGKPCCQIQQLDSATDDATQNVVGGGGVRENVLIGVGGVRIPVLRSIVPITVDGRKQVLESFIDVRMMQESEQALAQQAMEARLIQHAALMAADACTVEEVLQAVVDMICEVIGWPVGHAYISDPDHTGDLIPTSIWHLAEPADAFVDGTMKTRFAPGVGLPGRILKSGESAKIFDVHRDDNFPRAALAEDLGLKGAFGFPIMVRDEVVAVLEFFSKVALTLDEDLLGVMRGLGEQVGRVFERRQAEEQLRLQSCALEAAANAILITDRQGGIIWANTAAAQMTGYEHEELIGSNARMFSSGKHDRVFYEDMWKSILSGRVWHGELINRRKDGVLYDEEMTITPVRIDGVEITHFIAIKQDTTARRQAEAEAIKHMKLEQERNQLRQALSAHERVIGVVGHELRTPLAGVRAMAEFLISAGSREIEEFDVFLRNIHSEVVRMSTTVNDLLEVTRLNSGVATWNWDDVSLNETCEAAMAPIRYLIDHARIKLILDVDPAGLSMTGDGEAIRRLALNLLNNAAKHTTEGSIRLTVRRLEQDGHSWVRLEVRDTGEGISEAIAKRLGTPFALNAGIAGGDYVKGSGLGLAICKGIVAAHGGKLYFETKAGHGTTVTVELRADLAEAVPLGEVADIPCEVKA